jgi:predicted TIM-barrel fold metal-dependent hydrolase
MVGSIGCSIDTQRNLAAHINGIRAIDDHAHVFAPDVPGDTDYDALRCEPLPTTPGLLPPGNVRFGGDTQATWKALYGQVPASAEEAAQKVSQLHAGLKNDHGDSYYNWVLDQAGVDVVLANRVAMTPGLKSPRFRWVPYADALIFPLNNAQLAAETADRKVLFAAEGDLLQRYLKDLGRSAVPATLARYLDEIVRPTLRKQKEGGAVGLKFEAAYLRGLDFAPASPEAATAIYQRYATATSIPSAEYKTLQDHLFHEVAVEAGRLGLVVQIHTGTGCGESFDVPGSDPLRLTAVFNDPTLRGTTFVMLHGGSPFERHPMSLILKPNVYVDTSVLELMMSVRELALVLRPWLETMPEHVLFGTDADFFGPGMEWVETTWLAASKGRQALTNALLQLVNDGVMTEDRAKEVATLVLRENARRIYHLDK